MPINLTIKNFFSRYGLTLPKKNLLTAPKAGNIFGHDDESEEEEGTDWVKKALKAENEKNKIKKQTKINMQKALQEDPTIFQYDEVYEEMERTKEEGKAVKKEEQKAKYIENLMKSADLRKKEQELRKDRQIQKEIEAEDAMYADKERFVTSSYKAKLEQMKKDAEEEENRDRIEAICDVTKQKDMTGFYRHLYRQTVEKTDLDRGIVADTKKQEKEESNVPLPYDIDKDDPIPSDSESDANNSKSDDRDKKENPQGSSVKNTKEKRQYRKRAAEASGSESESEPEKEGDVAGEGRQSDKVDDAEDSETAAKKRRLSNEAEDKVTEEGNKISTDDTSKQENEKSEKPQDSEADKENAEVVKEKPKQVEKKRVNIWIKRTVGKVFEAALERYLIRKQARLEGSA